MLSDLEKELTVYTLSCTFKCCLSVLQPCGAACEGRKQRLNIDFLLAELPAKLTEHGCDGYDSYKKQPAHQPVMQVVKRSPQDTDLMVTPD